MKIALCLEYPIEQHGGTEVLVSELVRGLGAHHQVLLVSPDEDATLRKSPLAKYVCEHICWVSSPPSVSRAKKLACLIAQAKPDLVHFHLGGNYTWHTRIALQSPIFQFRKSGIPCLTTNHGAFSIFEGYCGEKKPFLMKLALFLPAWISKQCVLAAVEKEVAVSQYDYRALRRWYAPMRHKFGQIYHSRIQEQTPPPFNPDRQKVILCAGTIGPRKGQTFLVEAFAQIAPQFPEWQLVLIGRGGDPTMTRHIRQFMAKPHLEKQIRWLGPCSDAELVEHLKRSAVFAMPSLFEGLGLSLQEAQFYGCACIGTRCGGVEDLIQDGDNGLLVPAGRVPELAAGLKDLLANSELRARLGIRGQQSVLEKGMTASVMVKRYEQLYSDILNKSS